MKTAAIIQARCGSSRFPNKVFADICGQPLIYHVVDRLQFSKRIDQVVLATTENPLDDRLAAWGEERGVTVYRGSEEDVLQRYAGAARAVSADVIVRVTADDPFKDPALIDAALARLEAEGFDVVCNNIPPTYPEGLDVEVFTISALMRAQSESVSAFEREHVTQYFYRHPALFRIGFERNTSDLSRFRWTIDTELDLAMVRRVYEALYRPSLGGYFTWRDILSYLEKAPEVASINSDVPRSAMYSGLKFSESEDL